MNAIAVTLLLAALAAPGVAQVQFDLITLDQLEIDPSASLGIGMSWGLLVNTGTQPISLEKDWEGGLWYGECSAPIGQLIYSLVNPFVFDLQLQPGEAVGLAHPLFLAELLPGETLVGSGLIANVQVGVPYPAGDYDIDILAQVDDQLAHAKTHVTHKSLGGASSNWVSAKRYSSVSAVDPVTRFGVGCSSSLLPALTVAGGTSLTAPPHAADGGNMPHLGNGGFGLRIYTAFPTPLYFLGIDMTPGSFLLGGCEVILGMTPQLILKAGINLEYQVTVPIPVPNDPGLIGATVYAQALLVSSFVETTNALAITIVDAIP